jgi:hypothetical protein
MRKCDQCAVEAKPDDRDDSRSHTPARPARPQGDNENEVHLESEYHGPRQPERHIHSIGEEVRRQGGQQQSRADRGLNRGRLCVDSLHRGRLGCVSRWRRPRLRRPPVNPESPAGGAGGHDGSGRQSADGCQLRGGTGQPGGVLKRVDITDPFGRR